MAAPPLPKVFVSYTGADRTWAEWIAWELEAAGYETVIQAWDFRPGSNFVLEMQKAATGCGRTVAVLSDAYLAANFTAPEWAAAFRVDPKGENQTLVPVRVAPCKPEGLLGPLVYIDLVGLDEATAGIRLLAGFNQGRAKPANRPGFPGATPAPVGPAAKPAFPPSLPRYWNVPARNPFFTGRDELLHDLHAELSGQRRAILSGLGGIGKTQTAIAYAHRHRDAFTAVFFLRADTETNLIAGFVEIAALLGLPVQDAQNQSSTFDAVLRWLGEKTGWLLIADNADELPLARRFLSLDAPGGCLLLTSRESATLSFAPPRKVLPLDTDPGARLLLQRAGWLTVGAPLETVSTRDLDAARELSRELGGLPLSLDQAGAFIEEMPSSPAEYLTLYKNEKHAPRLRAWKSEVSTPEHDTVAVTFILAFEKVAAANPAAADLLRLCAFLAPDDLPEAALRDGASALSEPLASALADDLRRRETIRDSARFSLLHCDSTHQTINLHRQVSGVLRDWMTAKAEEEAWITQALSWLARAFPNPQKLSCWPQCEILLPHALACAGQLNGARIVSPAASLLDLVGSYLRERARYTEAEAFDSRALAIRERALGASHPDTAVSLNNLAELYYVQAKFADAEALFIRALAIRERALGASHPDTAVSLNNLAETYRSQGKLAEAEPLLERALAINELILGSSHPNTATSLNNLAQLYRACGKLNEAEPLFERAMAICEQMLGVNHPDSATSLNNLGALYYDQGRFEKAEPLLKRAIVIWEQVLGTEHPSVSTLLENLAVLLRRMGRNDEAAVYSSRAKASREAHERRNAQK